MPGSPLRQAGLPSYGGDRRRVPGCAGKRSPLLAGVSPQYYIRLERGDATGVSESVIDGIARALRLDDAEHAHLHGPDPGPPAPAAKTRRRRAGHTTVRPTIQRMVDSMHLSPAVVLNGRLDMITANTLGRAMFAPVYR